MAGPLIGTLVVAVEQAVAAPTCTVRLADAGARVIKIERREGETARHYDQAVKGTSAYFAWLNRGKESAVLDLKEEGDRALTERMIGRADVFVQNLAPGAASRLGLAAGQLVARYPALVAVDIVGYAQDTPYRAMRAYDMLVQAESGICSVTGTDAPAKVGVSIADVGTGMNAHAAVLEALIARSRSGRGRAIEIAMFDSMADWMSVPLMHLDYGGRETPRGGMHHAAICPYGAYACADGVVVVVVQNPAEWGRFCRGVLERPDLVEDARFADNPSRVAHRQELDAAIHAVFKDLRREELVARLEASRLAYAKVSTVADLSAHPALRRTEVSLPGGSYRAVASPLHRHLAARPVPALGEHTEALRAEFAAIVDPEGR